MTKSVKTQLIITILLIGLLPAIIVNFIFYMQINNSERNILERDSLALINNITRDLRGHLSIAESLVGTVAIDDNNIALPLSMLSGTDPDSSMWRTATNTLRNSINRLAQNFPESVVDVFLTVDGKNIVYTQQGVLLDEGANLSFIDQALTTDSQVWSSWFWSANSEAHVIYVAAPVRDFMDQVIGTIGLGISEASINEQLHGFESPNGLDYNAYLVNSDGMLLSSSTNQELTLGDKIETDFIKKITETLSLEGEIPSINQQYNTYNETNVLGYANLIDFGSESLALVVETPASDAFANIARLRIIAFAIIILAAIAIGILSFILATNITKPILELVNYTERTASGDLSIKIESQRKDEIGALFGAFNKMTENLREMILAITTVANNASAASEQLSAASEENSATIQEIVSSISEYAQTTKNVSNVSQAMSKQAKNVQELSDRGRQQMGTSNSVMLEILETSKLSQQKITNLEQAANEINQVVKIISEVAEQTNLLALNAAIEAARAGEHGRGFAVVADEVRQLAEQTQESVGTIVSSITQLRNGTAETVQVINNNNNQIETGAKSLDQTRADFASITTSIEDTVKMINQVTSSGQDLEAGMAEIAASSEEQAASMEQIATNAENVARMAEEMSRLVNRFTL